MRTTTSLFPRPGNESLPLKSSGAKLSKSVSDCINDLRPSLPVNIIYPKRLQEKAKTFVTLFPGTVMYAVKCNPDKHVIQNLVKGGIKTFDVASIDEVRLVRKWAPKAKIHFMHTVKSREAIREAYFEHGVRVFVLDTADELHKILHETALAPDLELYIRLALPKNPSAAYDFSVKFGAPPPMAADLLIEARLVAAKLGVMFHPGSQSTDPAAFRRGIETAADVIAMSGVSVDALDVGGGFPVTYPGSTPPPLEKYMTEIVSAVKNCGLGHLDLFCEPGRALVAESGSLITRIELRKDNVLYLNDGTYGGMVEAAKWGGLRFTTVLLRANGRTAPENTPTLPFKFNGPTCDSLDMMDGPFMLPADTAEGDWIEIRNMGAYSQSCRSQFNGFGKSVTILLDSEE